jgi:hypothetical protein
MASCGGLAIRPAPELSYFPSGKPKTQTLKKAI